MQDGYTALMHAAYNGHVNVVQCLVEGGANLKAAGMVSFFYGCKNVCFHVNSFSHFNLPLTALR